MRGAQSLAPGRRRRGGFTALEIAMVSSVIAILALLILPLFTKRTDESKIVAARDELQSAAKATVLVEADTDRTFRFFDYASSDVPTAEFYRTLTNAERASLLRPAATVNELGASYWRGPYLAFQKSLLLSEIDSTRPYFLSTNGGGPIYYNPSVDETDYRVPVDPWGSPYIYLDFDDANFRQTLQNIHGLPMNQIPFRGRLIYSLGADGLPGSLDVNPAINAGFNASDPFFYVVPYSLTTQNGTRQGGVLGAPNSDDLEYRF
ncbi:MAG: hypothetical protein KBA51_10040 [Kiritimatiellae bacterium]|nr:hypothetical protein [Kiritimatiellia bacterium]